MTDERLQFDAVDVRRAPGFDADGFAVDDLSSGINVVHGPNASGKTTLAESVQALLWPEAADDRSTLIGQLSLDGDDWRVNVAASRATYQRNGADASRPTLPAAVNSDRYRLSLHDLLQHDTRNESFAEEIQRESIGGYDIDAAADALGFDDSPSTRGISEHGAATNAREAWREARAELERLENEEARLARLESELDAASEAKSRVRLLERAIEYAEARNDLEAAGAELAAFPDVLDEMDGTEAERVEELNDRIRTKEETIADATEREEQAEAAIEAAGLPADGVTKGFVDGLKERRDELADLEDDRERLERERADAERRREQARTDVPLEIDDETMATLEPAAWGEIAEFLQRAEALQADRNAHAAVENWLTNGDEPDAELSTLQDGRRALENWLSAPPAESDDGSTVAFRVGAVSAFLLALIAALLGAVANPGFLLLLPVAAGLFWYAYRASRQEAGGTDERGSARTAFERLSLESPDAWTEDAVRGRLTELYAALADAQLATERTERRAALTDELDDLEERAVSLEAERSRLREAYGVAPETGDTELAAITKGILRWQEANDDVQGTAASIETLDEQIADHRRTLESELTRYGYDAVPDAQAATQRIRELDSRREQHDRATDELAQVEETLETARTRRDELVAERETVFTEVGIDVDAEDRLRELCEQVEAYEAARATVGEQRTVCERAAEALEADPAFEPKLKEQSVAELEEAKQDAEELAASYAEIQGEISDIEARIDQAKRDTALEEAATEKRRALDALEERRDADAAALVGDVLVDHVREQTEASNRPEVFETARRLLSRITVGRYRLDLDEDGFRAYDTVKERGFAVDELSSATRLQLLLAVRIAFVEQQEEGVKLPLLLDETLANTDDRRADAIVDAVIELARAGRQVFYFTAQGDEVDKWRRALAETDDVDYRTVDLAEATGRDDHVDVTAFEDLVPEPSSLPDPDEHDHAEYGEALGVPAFSPREGAGSAHVWYVVEDPALLHHLLELGVERWGQLAELLDRTDSTLVADDESVLEEIRRNGAALEEFVKSWEIGRGKRVDRQVLEQTSAVTESFIDEVSALARELDGDGEALIEALRDGRVNRFRRNKMDELAEYLAANGYIQDRESLEPTTIRTRVVSRLRTSGLQEAAARERAFTLFKRLQSAEPATTA